MVESLPGTPFTVRVPLRWVDLDAQGHVNNALVVDYLQEGRIAFLKSGPNAALLDRGCLVVGHQVEFQRPIMFDTTPVEVAMVVGTVGASRFTLGSQVLQHGEVVAQARTVLCVVDPRTLAPRRMTPPERSCFADAATGLGLFPDLGRWRVGPRAHDYDAWVRWSDIDTYGHMNNVKVFDLFAEARIRANPSDAEHTRMEDAARDGLLWMVARQDVSYHVPILYGAKPYRVRTAYAKVGRTSLTLSAQVERPGDHQVCARATTVVVCGDATGHPVPVPQQVADGMAVWPAVAS